jgi:hypothetical protein
MLENDVGNDPFHSAWSIKEKMSLDVYAFEGELMTDKTVQRGTRQCLKFDCFSWI